jgi:hypothetical protein
MLPKNAFDEYSLIDLQMESSWIRAFLPARVIFTTYAMRGGDTRASVVTGLGSRGVPNRPQAASKRVFKFARQ